MEGGVTLNDLYVKHVLNTAIHKLFPYKGNAEISKMGNGGGGEREEGRVKRAFK